MQTENNPLRKKKIKNVSCESQGHQRSGRGWRTALYFCANKQFIRHILHTPNVANLIYDQLKPGEWSLAIGQPQP